MQINFLKDEQYVKVEKMEQVSDTETLAVGYWVKGRLVNEIEIGVPVLVERYIRNGVKRLGVMNTSPVCGIYPWTEGERKGVTIRTENSVYSIEYISKDAAKDEAGTIH